MALNIVLAILVIVGTLAGTGLGYALSMRGKREEWKKEYREKRVTPLVDYVNVYMEAAYERNWAVQKREKLEARLKEATDEDRQRITEDLEAVAERQIQANERMAALFGSSAWLGFFSVHGLDKQLDDLLGEWMDLVINIRQEPTDENLAKGMLLSQKILARADEFVIKG